MIKSAEKFVFWVQRNFSRNEGSALIGHRNAGDNYTRTTVQAKIDEFDAHVASHPIIPRTVTSDPQDGTPANRPGGTLGELVYYSGKWYGCTDATTPAWEQITST